MRDTRPMPLLRGSPASRSRSACRGFLHHQGDIEADGIGEPRADIYLTGEDRRSHGELEDTVKGKDLLCPYQFFHNPSPFKGTTFGVTIVKGPRCPQPRAKGSSGSVCNL
jgi:hypothetical protein